MNVEKLQKMAGAVRTGGKGTMRRKKKGFHKALPGGDKKLQSTLNRLDFKILQGIEEINIFKDDVVIHFQNPKVHVRLPAHTWVVSGSTLTRKLIDILPEMYHHLGAENLEDLKKMSEQVPRQAPRATLTPLYEDSDDGDVPELGSGDETFEAASERDYYY